MSRIFAFGCLSLGLFLPSMACTLAGHGAGESKSTASVSFDELRPRLWNWIPVPETTTLDGGNTGIWVRPGDTNARKLLVYFHHGASCAQKESCTLSYLTNSIGYEPSTFDFEAILDVDQEFPRSNIGYADELREGVFSPQDDNPFANHKGYHQVFIPYAYGDLYGGSAEATIEFDSEGIAKDFDPNAEGRRAQLSFNGLNATKKIMNVLRTLFRGVNVEELVVSGGSAGSFGAILHYKRLRQIFAEATKHTLVALSGISIEKCRFEQVFKRWNLEQAMEEACEGCISDKKTGANIVRPGDTDGLGPVLAYLLKSYEDDNFIFLTNARDKLMSLFMTMEIGDCAVESQEEALNSYASAMRKVRDNYGDYENFWTFFTGGDPTIPGLFSRQHILSVANYPYGRLDPEQDAEQAYALAQLLDKLDTDRSAKIGAWSMHPRIFTRSRYFTMGLTDEIVSAGIANTVLKESRVSGNKQRKILSAFSWLSDILNDSPTQSTRHVGLGENNWR